MSKIQQLPNEIVLLLLLQLQDQNEIVTFLSTSRQFYYLTAEDLFWRDFIQRKYRIRYKHPDISWYQLFTSGDAATMCCHLHSIDYLLQDKRDSLWETLVNSTENDSICMEPNCQLDEAYPGHARYHYQKTGHAIMLSLSPLNFMKLWCYSCNHSIGYWGIPKLDEPISEKYICRQILDFMTQLPNNAILRQALVERRRNVEQIIVSQDHHDYTFLIEKQWFMTWIDFLMGKTNELPSCLDNSSLFYHDKLRHDLIIGVDFELVGRSIQTYIERVYGLSHQFTIVSGDDYIGQPHYRSISQSVLLRRKYTNRLLLVDQ